MLGLVYVVDDDASFQASIRRLLEKAGYRVETFSSAQEVLGQLPNQDLPGCVLLDVRLLDLSGSELQTRLNERGVAVPIISLMGYSDISRTLRAIKAGAVDVLTKPVKSAELLDAIEKAIARASASKVAIDGNRIRFASLTPRERQVFQLVVRGNVNRQIAHQLGTASRTVKAHRERVMEKMRVQSLAELVAVAVRLGELNE